MLGLNVVEILFHLLNLAILMVAIRFLLYKPVKKYMEKRAHAYEEQKGAIDKAQAAAEQSKEKYEQLLEDAKAEADKITAAALTEAKQSADGLVTDAKRKANAMLSKAGEDIALMREREKEEVALLVPELAIEIAARLMEREMKAKDNDAVITSVIEEWKKSG